MTKAIQFTQISATQTPDGVADVYLLDENGQLWNYYRGEYSMCGSAHYLKSPNPIPQ